MTEKPIVAFASREEFWHWLERNHATHGGIWLRIFKKAIGIPTVTYAEVLDEALYFGWIDGQKKPYDDQSWLQGFSRRSPRSVWSRVNTGHVGRLVAEGRMQPAGMAAFESAKAWDPAEEAMPRQIRIEFEGALKSDLPNAAREPF